MKNYLVIKGADFSDSAIKQVSLVDNWDKVAPITMLDYNDYPGNVQANLSFGSSDQIIKGSDGYSLVEIEWKGASAGEMDVVLFEVPQYSEEASIQTVTYIEKLGTITLKTDEFVTAKFDLPVLDSEKYYMVCCISKAQKYYITQYTHYDSNVHAFSINYTSSVWSVEKYVGLTHGRGSYIWSFFQQRFV